MPKAQSTPDADREFDYRLPWAVVVWFGVFAVLMPPYALAFAFDIKPFSVSSVPTDRVALSCVFGLFGILSGLVAIRTAADLILHKGKGVLTKTSIDFAFRSRLWIQRSLSVPYAEITKVRYVAFGKYDRVAVFHAGGRFKIDPSMFRRKEDFAEFLDGLFRRLESSDVEVEVREYLSRRPQFSLRFTFVITTLVAAGLGLRMYVAPDFGLSDLIVIPGFAIVLLIYGWLIFFAGWTARIFALGFVLGGILEFYAVCLVTKGTMSQVPCSFNLICHLVPRVHTGSIEVYYTLCIFLGAMTTSGVLAGTASMLIWMLARRMIRAKRAPGRPNDPPR